MLTIHECTFSDKRCETYNCQNHRGFRKFYIGRPDVEVPKQVVCEPCVRNMLANVPLEFEGATVQDHAAKLEAALKETMERKLAEQKAQLEAVFRGQYVELLSTHAPIAEEAPVVEEEKVEGTPKLRRCLDCGEDFNTQKELAAHKKAKH